ncbi:hypothetical protein N9S10_02530 [Gammaproteobacteria bacterium]|jgi:hypothetical protein|nr:hypothetical protein [Gammaproteobacteria bacterium]
MATTVTITPKNSSITASSQTTTLTISSAIATSVNDASTITFSSPVGTLGGQDNVEDALNFLANQFYVATTAPSADTTNLAEGDLFYDTDDNQLKIYRETSTGNFEFVPIMIGNESADSDTVDAGGF